VCFSFVKIFCCYVYFVSDVCFVNLFRSILPVLVPTECDVLIVCRQHKDKEFKSGSLRNSMQKCGKIVSAGGEKILSPPWFQHCGGERPRRSDASETHPIC